MMILDWLFSHSLIGWYYDSFQILPGLIDFRGVGCYFTNYLNRWDYDKNRYTMYIHREHLLTDLGQFQFSYNT